jgi:hypothetical protein
MRQIVEHLEPILLVSHDADDHGWQFVGSSVANMADARLVCPQEIVRLDPTVLEVADLPPGWQAIRDGIGKPWSRRPTSELEVPPVTFPCSICGQQHSDLPHMGSEEHPIN